MKSIISNPDYAEQDVSYFCKRAISSCEANKKEKIIRATYAERKAI